MSAENLQFVFFTDVPGGESVISALTKYNNAPHKNKNGVVDQSIIKEDFYYFDQVIKVPLTNRLIDVLDGIKRREKEYQIKGGSGSSGGTTDAKSEDACERNLIEQFKSVIDDDRRLKIFTWYWLLKPLKQKIKDDASLKGDIGKVLEKFLRRNKAYFLGITEYNICDYLEVGFEGDCYNCGQAINSKENNYTCTCGAKHADKNKFFAELEKIKTEYNSLYSICNSATSCFDAVKLTKLFNSFISHKLIFESLIHSFLSEYRYGNRNSWFIQNDPTKTIDRLTKEITAQKANITKKAEAAKRGEFVCWDGSMISLINSNYNAFLSNADKVCTFVMNHLLGQEKTNFVRLLENLQLSNQKLFLAQLYMPNCDNRGKDIDYRLIYWKKAAEGGRKDVNICFNSKNESELLAYYQELDTLYYDDHVGQLLTLEKHLLSTLIERLNIDVDSFVINEIEKLANSRT